MAIFIASRRLTGKSTIVSSPAILRSLYTRLYSSSSFREERDTFGPIQVPSDKLWGAQTQRSLRNFEIGGERERMPEPIIRAFGIWKKCAAKLLGEKEGFLSIMHIFDTWNEILKIQKFRRVVSYTGFYCFVAVLTYAYTNNTTRSGYSRGDQFYASYPAGTELLTDTAKLYKVALGNCFEVEDWGPVEFSIMAKHFERQGKSPYAYHSQYMAHLLSHGQLDGSG